MSASEITRRQLFVAATGAGLGPFVARAAAQQMAQVPSFSVNPRELGRLHSDTLDRLSRALERRRLDLKEGLFRVVDLLVELGLVTRSDGEALKRLIEAILESPTIDAMAERINRIYRDTADKAGEVAIAIMSIARDSIEYVRKLGDRIDVKRAIYIVSSDVSGALMGAAAVAKVGPPILAVIGALAGAVAGSGSAVFASQRG